jgi:hypothetical protein
LKFHLLKAEHIVRAAWEACSSAHSSTPPQNLSEKLSPSEKISESTCEQAPIARPLDNPAVAASKRNQKRGGHERVLKGKEKKAKAPPRVEKDIEPASDFEKDLSEDDDIQSKTGDTDSEVENSEEGPNAYEADVVEEAVEEDDWENPQWEFQVPPMAVDAAFKGASGPKHGLPPESALPIDYFLLFIPMYLWVKFAAYTNEKANMTQTDTHGKTRSWKPISAAELKAFVASIIWWCICRSLSFEQFFKNTIDQNRLKNWFPSWVRWCQVKRFFKVSNPKLDDRNKHDRIYKVRELYDIFVNACKANYWPQQNVAVDEAIKKFKGRCIFKQYIKNKPVKWGIKVFCLCCSSTSYLFNCMFYVGKTREEDTVKDQSATQETVKKLLSAKMC